MTIPETRICDECKCDKPLADFQSGQTRVRNKFSKRCRQCRAKNYEAWKDREAKGLHLCAHCKQAKPFSEFSKTSEKYYSHRCNQCSAIEQEKRRRARGVAKVLRRRCDIGDETTGFVCRVCRIKQPTDQYHHRKDGQWDYRCKKCQAKRTYFGSLNMHARFLRVRRWTLRYRRNIEWHLTEQEYCGILHDKLCYYCGFQIPDSGVGLDRKDSKLGYTVSNVVPCCHQCNAAKADFFTFEEMVLIGKTIASIKAARINHDP